MKFTLFKICFFVLALFPLKTLLGEIGESLPRFIVYLFKKIQNSFQFFPLSFMRSFLSEADFSSNKGIIDNVENVAVVILKEEKGFLEQKINKVCQVVIFV